MPLLRFPRSWLKKVIFKTIFQHTIIFTESNRLIRCVIVSSPRLPYPDHFILLCIYKHETLKLLAHIWRKSNMECFYLWAGLPEENMTSGYIWPSLFIFAYSNTVKKGSRFSHPQTGCHLPNSHWPGIILLFPAKESLVSHIRDEDGKSVTCGERHYMYILRSLFVVIPVILSCLIWEGLLVKIRQSGYEEKILHLRMCQSSPESCWINTYPAPPWCLNKPFFTVNCHPFTPEVTQTCSACEALVSVLCTVQATHLT
jgi:hypothetical protein